MARAGAKAPVLKKAGALGDEIGILRDALKGKGNFGLGSSSRADADAAP